MSVVPVCVDCGNFIPGKVFTSEFFTSDSPMCRKCHEAEMEMVEQ